MRSTPVISLRAGHVLPLLLTLVCGALLAACGGSSGPGATARGTLSGEVVAGPTTPVQRVGGPSPTRPVPHRAVTIEDAGGHAAATATTDAGGHFSVGLAPGAYTVRVAIVPGSVGLRQVTPGQVTVVAGQTTSITIELDTGIR